MQTVNNILKIAGGETTVTDEYGKKLSAPAVKIGISYLLELDLRSDIPDEETGVLLPLPWEQVGDAQSFYLCVDGDWDKNTTPKLLTSSNIKLEQTEDGRTLLVAALPNTLREALINEVNKKKSVSLMCEIGGYKVTDAEAGTTETIFCFNFDLVLQNRLYYGDAEIPEDVIDNPEYLTRLETLALINEFLRSETPGPDGLSAYQVAQKLGFKGTEAEWLESLKGINGAPGNDGQDGKDGLSAYALAVQGGYSGTLTSWLESLKGEAGESAYQIAVRVQNFKGTEQEWLNSLHGKDGTGMQYDAFGNPEDRSIYDNQNKGFRFMASVNDDGVRVSYVYIWEKLSNGLADWSEPLIIKNYGNTQTKFNVIQPVVMDYWDPGVYDFFQLDLKDYPYVMICQVTLDTADGELVLPLWSDFGVKKILFVMENNARSAKIYLGKQIPSWTRGRIYLSQFVATEDIKLVTPTAKNKIYYGYIYGSNMASVKGITWDILKQAIADKTMVEIDAKTLPKTSIGTPPAGAFTVVIVPENGFVATKDNGFGGQTSFIEDTPGGLKGTGANGAEIILNSIKYKVYGEFQLNNAEVSIYVNNSK
jgi:hypothetical protein